MCGKSMPSQPSLQWKHGHHCTFELLDTTRTHTSIIFFGRSNPANSLLNHKSTKSLVGCWMHPVLPQPNNPTKMLPLDRSLSRKLRRWCRLHTSPPWSSFLPTYWVYRSRFFGGVSQISDRLMGYMYIYKHTS